MINTIDRKSKNILINGEERSHLRHELIKMFCQDGDKFSLEEMEVKFPYTAEFFLLLSLRN